jgi:hypothetical protein
MVGCAPVSPPLAAGLPFAVAVSCEQDHQLIRGAIFFERKCCLLVTCRHTHKKNRAGAYWLLLNEPIFRISCFSLCDRAAAPLLSAALALATISVQRPSQRPYPTAKPVRYVQYECYETTARSETQKLARVGPARCTALSSLLL